MNKERSNKPADFAVARSRRRSPVLVCRKCVKRCAAGREIKRDLKRELKQATRNDPARSRIVATSCLGICPKRAVTVASATSLQNGEYLLISNREGVAGALEALLRS